MDIAVDAWDSTVSQIVPASQDGTTARVKWGEEFLERGIVMSLGLLVK